MHPHFERSVEIDSHAVRDWLRLPQGRMFEQMLRNLHQENLEEFLDCWKESDFFFRKGATFGISMIFDLITELTRVEEPKQPEGTDHDRPDEPNR